MNIYPVHPSLQAYIYNIVHIQAPVAADGSLLQVDFYPHGFPTLIYNMSADASVLQLDTGRQISGRFTLNGIYDRHVAYQVPAIDILVVNFRPYGAHYITQMHMKKLLNGYVEMEEILPEIRSWSSHLNKIKHIPEIINHLQQWLLEQIPSKQGSIFHKISEAVALIQQHAGTIAIPDVCEKAAMSISSLEAHFNEKIGISPKKFARIIRFNHCYKYMLEHPDISWSKVAYQYQYTDQVHFIKEFKQFMGCTPSQINPEAWIISEKITSLCV